MRSGGIVPLVLAALALGNQDHQDRQQAAAEGQGPPQHALPMRRHLRGVHWRGRGHTVFAPHNDGVVIQFVHAPPAGKLQQRIVIRVAYENPFQAVTVRVLQHGPQCIEPRLAEIL